MKKIWGNISLLFAKIVDGLFKGLVYLFEGITSISNILRSIVIPIIMLLIFGSFAFPVLLIFWLTGLGFTILLILLIPIIVSILGKGGLRYLYKWQYASNRFFNAYANDYLNDTHNRKKYSDYTQEYIDELNRQYEEERRREEEARRKRQQQENERWEKIFEEYFNSYGRSGSYTGGSNTGGYSGGYQRPGRYNPLSQFKAQYQQSCDVLGVSYNADFSEIKSAYRRLAKKYHPDLSKEKNAEEMFKKINNAFEFLSEENVKRYKEM